MKWVWRVLAGVVLLLVLGAGVLLALGSRRDAGILKVSIEIARPPAVVWRWVTESDKLLKWVSWLVEIRKTGPHREVWVMEDRNNGNARMEIIGESVLEDPPRLLKAHTSAPGEFQGEEEFVLTDLGGGRTRLEYISSFYFSQWFARLMEPLVSHEARAKMVGDMAHMKSLIESIPMTNDLEKLQGTWNVVALEMSGKTLPPAALTGTKLVINGDKFQSITPDGTLEGDITVDASASPKQFEMTYKNGPVPGHRSLGIYELNGDTWKACFTVRKDVRPTTFATAPGSDFVFDTLQRQP